MNFPKEFAKKVETLTGCSISQIEVREWEGDQNALIGYEGLGLFLEDNTGFDLISDALKEGKGNPKNFVILTY